MRELFQSIVSIAGKTGVAAVLLIPLTLFASGCGGSSSPRDFTRTVEHQGKPVLRVECRYVGKQPGDVESYVSQHDYRSVDTDFYRITFANLTNDEISLEGVTYRMESGPMSGPRSASADSIKKTWGTNIVPPNSSISRANNMVWSKSRNNRLVKSYQFRIPLDDGKHDTFIAEVPLVYKR